MLKEISEHLDSEGMTHCVVCWSGNEKDGIFTIHHMCGYSKKPDKETVMSLVNELRLDEEFGMNDMIYGKDYTISLLETSELGILEDMIKEYKGVVSESDDPVITVHEEKNVG
ncbi:MAG: hypothetical protein BV459_06855 [Thermoplasmata archaeon M11B2D]|nr:MAG: hypothetical protein BV459_06855 [Thermoplasmata archaeon M11B2D]